MNYLELIVFIVAPLLGAAITYLLRKNSSIYFDYVDTIFLFIIAVMVIDLVFLLISSIFPQLFINLQNQL